MTAKGNVDYFGIGALLTPEEAGFRDRVREFVKEACIPWSWGKISRAFPRSDLSLLFFQKTA